ncbi:MAG: hypothetical protein J6M62_06370 [Selenomonadaceae bacterium]|nr:hypothetical protein [Selenomonadaceae bacterium]
MTLKIFSVIFTLFVSCVFVTSPSFAAPLSPEKDSNAYKILEDAGYGIETPDLAHNPTTAHITTVYDEELKRYVFAFAIHSLIDDDRGIASITDRQRVEIKTYQKSPSSMIAKEGDTLIVRYKMRLPAGFKTTNKFCHLHQLKGMDNADHTADVKHPLITLTACSAKDGEQKLELRYFDRKTRKMSVMTAANLEEILDEWVEVREEVSFGKNSAKDNNGKYSIRVVRLKHNREILAFSSDALDLWQTNSSGLRPKMGIYRSVGEKRSLEKYLRDEEVRFTDIEVRKM